MNKIISTISLSKKAGKLILGFDAVRDAVFKGETRTVFVTSDLSPKTEKNVRYFCQDEELEVELVTIPVNMDEIWHEVGKRAGVIAITDRGLTKKLQSLLLE